jgi:hypothetical protein
MAKKNKKSKKQDNNGALVAGLVAGGAGLLVGLVMLARRGQLGDSVFWVFRAPPPAMAAAPRPT